MDATELLRKVRHIEIKTRMLSDNVFAGQYHSAYKGRGMSFDEVREYQAGDDMRDIDWNVTARFGHPFTKLYNEERELTVLLLVDVSSSLTCGAHAGSAGDIVAEIGATLAFSADLNNDKIGVVFFSDRIEKYISPQKGRKHILYIIRELIELTPEGRTTDLGNALEFVINTQKKRCALFILSDFISCGDFEIPLNIAARKHDIAAIEVYDRFMKQLPDVGLVKMIDSETGEDVIVDSSSLRIRKAHAAHWLKHEERLKRVFGDCGVDYASLTTEDNYVDELSKLFKNRSRSVGHRR